MSIKILISPGFGAGWSTWEGDVRAKRMMLTDEKLIQSVETTEPGSAQRDAALSEFLERLEKETGVEPYTGGFNKIEVATVSGSFHVHEFEGSESVRYLVYSDDSWTFE